MERFTSTQIMCPSWSNSVNQKCGQLKSLIKDSTGKRNTNRSCNSTLEHPFGVMAYIPRLWVAPAQWWQVYKGRYTKAGMQRQACKGRHTKADIQRQVYKGKDSKASILKQVYKGKYTKVCNGSMLS